jgi:hypothetical protein
MRILGLVRVSVKAECRSWDGGGLRFKLVASFKQSVTPSPCPTGDRMLSDGLVLYWCSLLLHGVGADRLLLRFIWF